jgi:hypothetical protein
MTKPRLLIAALLACLSALPAATAGAAVPSSFYGVMGDGPLLDGRPDLARETRLMRASGIGTLRVAVYWRSMQPSADAPIDFSRTDRILEASARAGLDVLPVLVRAPSWATGGDGREGAVPDDPQTYANFCTAMVQRYGPAGSFWAQNPSVPRLPVRRWQLWNEPDIPRYWVGRPWAPTYVNLLRPASAAVRAADPTAQVVSAGLTNKSWQDLDELYEAGARGLFDAAAIHPFSRRVVNVVKIVKLARRTMAQNGDARKTLLLTEVSWSSGKGRSTFNYGWETTEKGQAKKIRQALPALTKVRRKFRLGGIWWYTWLSPRLGDDESFSYSGLRRMSKAGKPVSKPALRAFRSTVKRLRRAR